MEAEKESQQGGGLVRFLSATQNPLTHQPFIQTAERKREREERERERRRDYKDLVHLIMETSESKICRVGW